MRETWRDEFRELIGEVLAANQDKTLAEKRKALREAYPMQERRYWPYKVWCDECRIQLGLKISKVRQAGMPVPFVPAKGQRSLFE